MTKQKKVYLITKGSYSDYRVHLAFSTKEGAYKYLDSVSQESIKSEEIDIEEFLLDISHDKPFDGLSVHMNFKSGEVIKFFSLVFNFYDTYYECYDYKFNPLLYVHLDKKTFLKSDNHIPSPYLSMNFDHTDKERAAKVMSEKRAMIIAKYGSVDNLLQGYYHRDTLDYLGSQIED